MGCECTMRSPANVVCQHQIMSTEFDVGGLPMHYVIIQVHASMYSVAACHITRHLLHAYNEQLFSLLQ